jgi:hypothetical protein
MLTEWLHDMNNKKDEKLFLKQTRKDENGKLFTTTDTINITLSKFESDEIITNKSLRDSLLDFIQEGYEEQTDVEKFQIMFKDEVLYEISKETKGYWRNVKLSKEMTENLNKYLNGVSLDYLTESEVN